MKRIYDFYVVSLRFDGHGHGFAWGFDDEYKAYFVASRLLLGLANVISDYQMESWYPEYYHHLVSQTAEKHS